MTGEFAGIEKEKKQTSKQKRSEFFFFFFPENKEDTEQSEQAWAFLVFCCLFLCYFGCSQLCVSVPQLAFCPLTLQELRLTPTVLSLPRPHPALAVTHQKEDRRAPQPPDSIPGLLTPACDCPGEDSSMLAHHQALTASSGIIWAPRLLLEWGGGYCVPLHWPAENWSPLSISSELRLWKPRFWPTVLGCYF